MESDVYDERALVLRFIEWYQTEYKYNLEFYRKYSASSEPIIRSCIKSIVEFMQKEFTTRVTLHKMNVRSALTSTSSAAFVRLRLINEYNNLSDYYRLLMTPEPNMHLINELVNIRKRTREIIEKKKLIKNEIYSFRYKLPLRHELDPLKSVLDYAIIVL